MRLQAIKCSECGANLDLEEELKFCFCKYCGCKIILDDNLQTIIHRKIDEARIREAEYKEKVRLKELDIEENKAKLRNKLIVVWISVVIIIAIISIIILVFDKDNPDSMGYMLLLVDFNIAAWPPMIWIGSKNDKNKNR